MNKHELDIIKYINESSPILKHVFIRIRSFSEWGVDYLPKYRHQALPIFLSWTDEEYQIARALCTDLHEYKDQSNKREEQSIKLNNMFEFAPIEEEEEDEKG